MTGAIRKTTAGAMCLDVLPVCGREHAVIDEKGESST